MKKYISIIAGFAAMTMPFAAGAASHEILPQKKLDTRPLLSDQREEIKAQMKQEKETMKGEMKDIRSAVKEKMDAMRAEMRGKRDAMGEEMKKKREEFQAKAQERRDAMKKKIGEERAGRVEKFFTAMMEKFENAIDRLNKVADRLDDRLNASPSPAADVAALKDKLTAARAKIIEADAALADAKIKYAEAVKDADLKTAFRKVHDIVQSAAVKVKEAHRALAEVTTAIKSVAGREQEPPAATTPPQNQ